MITDLIRMRILETIIFFPNFNVTFYETFLFHMYCLFCFVTHSLSIMKWIPIIAIIVILSTAVGIYLFVKSTQEKQKKKIIITKDPPHIEVVDTSNISVVETSINMKEILGDDYIPPYIRDQRPDPGANNYGSNPLYF